jgi:hypothetical protein
MIAEILLCELGGLQAITLGVCIGVLLAIPLAKLIAIDEAKK